MERFENYMTRFMANWNKSQQDILDSIFTMAGEIEAVGTELRSRFEASCPQPIDWRCLRPTTPRGDPATKQTSTTRQRERAVSGTAYVITRVVGAVRVVDSSREG